MTSKKAWRLEHEARAYWEVSSAAAASSRGRNAKRAREGIEDLLIQALYGTTVRLCDSAEGAIRAIAESPASAKSARRVAEAALAELALDRASPPPKAS